MTFQGLKKFICENSKTRVLAFLNIACHGLAGAGCSGSDFGPGENDMQKQPMKLFELVGMDGIVYCNT